MRTEQPALSSLSPVELSPGYLLRLLFGLGSPLASVFECTIGLVGITRTGLTLAAIAVCFGALGAVAFWADVFVDVRVFLAGALVLLGSVLVFFVDGIICSLYF